MPSGRLINAATAGPASAFERGDEWGDGCGVRAWRPRPTAVGSSLARSRGLLVVDRGSRNDRDRHPVGHVRIGIDGRALVAFYPISGPTTFAVTYSASIWQRPATPSPAHRHNGAQSAFLDQVPI